MLTKPMLLQSSLPSIGKFCGLSPLTASTDSQNSTFALSFWYSIKMFLALELKGAETLIV